MAGGTLGGGRPLQDIQMVLSGPKAAQLWLGAPWGVGTLASLSIRAGGSKPPALMGGGH